MERPTGKTLLGWGYFFIVLGPICGIAWLFADSGDAKDFRPLLFVLMVAAFSCAPFFLALGHIVRAIWFLPGDDKKPEA